MIKPACRRAGFKTYLVFISLLTSMTKLYKIVIQCNRLLLALSIK